MRNRSAFISKRPLSRTRFRRIAARSPGPAPLAMGVVGPQRAYALSRGSEAARGPHEAFEFRGASVQPDHWNAVIGGAAGSHEGERLDCLRRQLDLHVPSAL